MVRTARAEGEVEWRGGKLKVYKNGNGHLFFDPEMLKTVNRALAEFYGDVLPDSPESEREAATTGTAVSKDLQFYPTPDDAADKMIDLLHFRDNENPKILEPSCGDGRIMNAVLRKFPRAEIVGVEYDAARVAACKAKGLRVAKANFLNIAPNPVYDAVVMNPPFYGTHWKVHLRHAIKFLKDDGCVICLLPASALVDGHLEEFGLKLGDHLYDKWHDLPTATFKESSTNIATGYVRLWKDKL